MWRVALAPMKQVALVLYKGMYTLYTTVHEHNVYMQFVYGLLPINVRKCLACVCLCECAELVRNCEKWVTTSAADMYTRRSRGECNNNTSCCVRDLLWCCGYPRRPRLDVDDDDDDTTDDCDGSGVFANHANHYRVTESGTICVRVHAPHSTSGHQTSPNGLHIFASVFKPIRIKTRCDEFHMVRPHYTELWTLTCIVLRIHIYRFCNSKQTHLRVVAWSAGNDSAYLAYLSTYTCVHILACDIRPHTHDHTSTSAQKQALVVIDRLLHTETTTLNVRMCVCVVYL